MLKRSATLEAKTNAIDNGAQMQLLQFYYAHLAFEDQSELAAFLHGLALNP